MSLRGYDKIDPYGLDMSGLPPEMQGEARALRNRERIAQEMLASGMVPLGQARSAGRYMVAPSWAEGAAKLANTAVGSMMERKAEQGYRGLGERQAEIEAQAVQEYQRRKYGTPQAPMAPLTPNDDEGNPMPAAQMPNVGADPRGAVEYAMVSRFPALQRLGALDLANLNRQEDRADTQAFRAEESRLTREGREQELKLRLGQPTEFEKALKAAGIDPASPEGQRLAKERLSKMTTHPAAASVKVDVKTGESLGKEIGPMVSESRASALGALQAGETAQRVRKALETGNVTLGPTATVRNTIDQLAYTMGVPGNNAEERLVNTRQVARGLAQFTIAARKSLKGQGQVSDFEGKLLQRAESGAIDDFTIPELKSFIDVTERLAKIQHGMHERNVDVMRKQGNLKNLVPFYEVPAWGAFNETQGGTPKSAPLYAVNPQTKQRIMSTDGGATWKPAP